jgi:hypothetical protein
LFIVRFTRYEMAADHLAAIQAALAGAPDAPLGSWEWVERRNPAAAYPTDFGLLRLAAAHQAAVEVRGWLADTHRTVLLLLCAVHAQESGLACHIGQLMQCCILCCTAAKPRVCRTD